MVSSLFLAVTHFAWNALIYQFLRGEIRKLETAREATHTQRMRQMEIEQRLTSASAKLDSISHDIYQQQRKLDEAMDGRLRFEILVGRPGINLNLFLATIAAQNKKSQGRDHIVWNNPVELMIWASGAERARLMIADYFPRSHGFVTTFNGPAAEAMDHHLAEKAVGTDAVVPEANTTDELQLDLNAQPLPMVTA